MIAYSLAVLAGLFVDAWVLALVLIRGHRPWLQATFSALVLTLIVNGAAFVAVSEGFLPPTWESVVLWTLVLAHPLIAILVLSLIHGEIVPRRRPAVLVLLALVPIVVFLTPSADWAVQHAYEPTLLGAFLIVCLGIALAEPIYVRMTSALFATDASWLVFAVAAVIIGGPVYAIEFQDLGLIQSPGSNLAAPIAVVLFALVLFHTDPFPRPRHRRMPDAPASHVLPAGSTVVLDEVRPKYAMALATLAARAGAHVLAVGRDASRVESDEVAVETAKLMVTRHAAARCLGTASEFWSTAGGGVFVLRDPADVDMMSGWARTEETILRMRAVCRDTGSRLVVSASRLTASEKEALRAHRLDWWVLPDPAIEMEAVLAQSFGPGARRLLDSYARSRGTRREDLSLDDVEPFLRFLDRALSELSGPAGDEAARAGLRSQAAAATTALRAFAARVPEDLAQGNWPSRRSPAADGPLLVTAADYWKGKEMDELFAVASDLGDRGSLFERTRTVFVEQLGDSGEGVLRSELAKLGRKPEDLRPEDVARLADRAAVDLVALADVVDVPQERERIRGHIESIRRQLASIAGDRT